MTGAQLGSLMVFAFVATATPGGATTLATASGARFGLKQSLPLIAGIATGLAALGAAAAAGLASLILAVPALALALKAAGSAYLLWLALGIARAGPPGTDASLASPIGLIGGAMLLWLNPKAWATALGAAATFGQAFDSATALALALFGIFGMAATLSLTLWNITGALLARSLRTERQWSIVNGGLGLLLALSILQMWL